MNDTLLPALGSVDGNSSELDVASSEGGGDVVFATGLPTAPPVSCRRFFVGNILTEGGFTWGENGGGNEVDFQPTPPPSPDAAHPYCDLLEYARIVGEKQEETGVGLPVTFEEYCAWMGVVGSNWAVKNPSKFLEVRETVLEYWEAAKRAGGYTGISLSIAKIDKALKLVLSVEAVGELFPDMTTADVVRELGEFGDEAKMVDFHMRKRQKTKPSGNNIHGNLAAVMSNKKHPQKHRPQPSVLIDIVLTLDPSLCVLDAQRLLMKHGSDVEKIAEEIALPRDDVITPTRTPKKRRVFKTLKSSPSPTQQKLLALPEQQLQTILNTMMALRRLDVKRGTLSDVRQTVESLIDTIARETNTTVAYLREEVFFI